MEQIKILLNENIKFIVIAGIAYALDFVTGFSKAVLFKNVQSSKLRKSVMKGIAYFAFIIIGACLEILFPSKEVEVFGQTVCIYWKLQIICLGISLTDFYSVYENTKEYQHIPFIAKILNYFKKEVKEKTNSYIPDLDVVDYENEVIDNDNGQVD